MRRFLEQVRIERYGALADFEVGPFGPGMNVVYGPNEAGKSSIASFIGGVLFGWEEARGVRNTYRPAEGERAGSLVFSDSTSGERSVVSRARNEDGLQGDVSLVADLDHATYRTMFALSSDELRSLRNSSDVTARLLTAGSGTGSSPAAAFVEVEQRIATLSSRDENQEGSIAQLRSQVDAKRAEIEDARERNALTRQENREYAELSESRAMMAARLDEANGEVERLREARAQAEVLDAQLELRRREFEELEEERAGFAAERDGARREPAVERLLALDVAEERLLRDSLEEYSEELARAQRAVDVANENSASSKAAYEALLELDEGADAAKGVLEGRRLQVVLSFLLPVAFVLCGVPLFVHGYTIRSLSFTAFGIGLVVLACFMAAAAFVVLFRPDRKGDALGERRNDAKWVMLQDEKKLAASIEAKQRLEASLAGFLAENGLGVAQGSVRRARSLVDDAHDARAAAAALDQRIASLDMRAAAARDAYDTALAERAHLVGLAGIDGDAPAHALDALVRRASEERDALSGALEGVDRRCGELEQRLGAARADSSFGRLKLEHEQLQCRLREAKRELVTLLLAKRMLDNAIAAWESRSQPEVYAQASRLLALMTGGAWVRVSMTGDGRLTATARDGSPREVRHLSLGTCQQLYLALRLAMLLHASAVGTCVPVLADDILVNFDERRRLAAATALAELSAKRQVIVFTCHKETVEALLESCPDANCIEL